MGGDCKGGRKVRKGRVLGYGGGGVGGGVRDGEKFVVGCGGGF